MVVPRRLVGVGLGVVLAAGLSSMVVSRAGTPSTPPLAPPITLDQLDVAAYGAKPCDLLRADRVARRHLATPGATAASPSGLVCRWTPTVAGHPVFSAGVDASQGLERIYQRRSEFPFFEPTEIARYPAVHTTSDPRGPVNGSCTIQIGVADTALLIVTADYGSARSALSADPCPDADTLATEIMGQLLAGSP